MLRWFLHLLLQYFTSSHTFSHFFLHVKGRLQTTQDLTGSKAFFIHPLEQIKGVYVFEVREGKPYLLV